MRPPLTARRVIVVAPHPDDEAIGAWALMRALRRQGARIAVVVVSDGGASHPQSRRWPPARLTRERQRETRRAMATLAIPPHRIRFLGLPDGALETMVARVSAAIAGALRRCPAPDLIVGPVANDAHGDHRAVAQAIARIPRRGERRLGYRVWPEDAAGPGHRLRIALSGREMGIKRRVVRGYRTQAGRITDAAAGFTMTARHLRAFVRPSERFAVLA
ncbi:PIG-L deacetylase family protein [Sphingomonas profundi]|uniref:PIG-L deacetylase family protein n=1 Tax=Alterirhizorhabdus profundi TaxID=2681549 RepID=UPI0012E90180|nr:PIG-L family deacetylase [Sphingomonas profundi]